MTSEARLVTREQLAAALHRWMDMELGMASLDDAKAAADAIFAALPAAAPASASAEADGSAEGPSEREALAIADLRVSVVHDRIYDEPFDRRAASDAVWSVHEVIRAALARHESAGSEKETP